MTVVVVVELQGQLDGFAPGTLFIDMGNLLSAMEKIPRSSGEGPCHTIFDHRNVTHRRYTASLQAANVAAMGKAAKTDIRERFGFAVKVRRETLELTQEDLAEKAGIHRTYLSDVERGTRNLSLINIERLASALSMSMSELFQMVEA